MADNRFDIVQGTVSTDYTTELTERTRRPAKASDNGYWVNLASVLGDGTAPEPKPGKGRELADREGSYRLDDGGNKIRPHMWHLYPKCEVCGKYVWHTARINGLCTHCVFARQRFELEISFSHSKSKRYRTVLKRVGEIPCHMKVEDMYIVRFGSLAEYCEQREAVEKLMFAARGRISFDMTLNGQPITNYHLICIRGEINRMRDLAKAEHITFKGGKAIYSYKPVLSEEEWMAQRDYEESLAAGTVVDVD